MGMQAIEKQVNNTQLPNETQNQNIKDQDWFKKLDLPQQEKVSEILGKIDDLTKKMDGLNAETKYKGRASESLFTSIKANPEMQHDTEAQPTIELYKYYRVSAAAALGKSTDIQGEIQKMEKMVKAITTGIEQMSNSKLEMRPEAGQKKYESQVSYTTDISKMSNADILALEPKERLKYITKGAIAADDIASGKTENLEFTFSQDGQLNRELYMNTTAGQVLPDEVRTVTSDSVTYERMGISGEFYNPDTKKRLVIHEGTKLNDIKTADISSLSEENINKSQEFIAKNKEYVGEKYKTIIDTAIEKGIEPKMFILVTERRIEEFEQQQNINKGDLDVVAADIARALSGFPKDGAKYSIETASKVAQRTTPTTWQETLEKYGYKKEEVTTYLAQNPEKNERYNLAGLNDFTPAEYSYPIERSESGTTLCSRTAFKNLERLGVTGHPRLGSANSSMDAYGTSISTNYPPNGSTEQNVGDFFIGGSGGSENFQKYGHRVAGFQKDGQWFILDPYYKIDGKNTQQPIPIEKYKSTLQAQGKDFKGVKYFA